jgi:ATP-dependent DNA ligase
LAPGKALFQEACRHGREAVVERMNTSYLPNSCADAWIKIEHREKRQFCMIMCIVPSGKDDFGSLIIAAEA